MKAYTKIYSIPQLKAKAVKYFNEFIRKRDSGKRCVSCQSPQFQHASHFYSAGKYELLRFNEDNVHGGCLKCNYFMSGNLLEYRKELEKRIGKERLEKLDILADQSKRIRVLKRDRFFYEDVIKTYKKKIKQLEKSE